MAHMCDPAWPLCVFDVRGSCKDAGCPGQHLRDGMLPGALACGELRARMAALGIQVRVRFYITDLLLLKCVRACCLVCVELRVRMAALGIQFGAALEHFANIPGHALAQGSHFARQAL